MARILFHSDSPTAHTGFARVGRKLCQDWVDHGHEVKYLGMCYQGEVHQFPYEVLGSDPQRDYWVTQPFMKTVQEWKPDVFFSLNDPWMIEAFMNLDEMAHQPWIGYFPLDGAPIPPYWLPIIDRMDDIILYSKWAEGLVNQALPHRSTQMIYHGVDLDLFKPLPYRDQIREANGLQNKFVVGCVARNQPRKNIPALVEGFANFAANKPDAVLVLRMARSDVGWNLDELVDRHNLWGKCLIIDGSANHGVTDTQLVEIYNMFNIMALPTMGEGFGLPIIEAQACGIPVLVTDCSACTELVQGQEELIPAAAQLVSNRNIEQAVIDPLQLAKKLNFWYNDWKTGGKAFTKFGAKGREWAEKEFDWSHILPRFRRIIDRQVQEQKYRQQSGKVVTPRPMKL